MKNIEAQTEKLYILTERMIFWFRQQNYYRANNLFIGWIGMFSEYIKAILKDDEHLFSADLQYVTSILKNLLDAQQISDNILIADYLENDVLDLLRYISEIINKNASNFRSISSDHKEYIVSDSLYHMPVLSIAENGISRNLCSISSPIREAIVLSNSNFSPYAPGYIIFGLGLGYLPVELNIRCDKAVPIIVFESDKNVLSVAQSFDYLKDNLSDNMQIIYDPDISKFSKALKEYSDYTMIIHAPSIKNINDPHVKKKVNELFIQDSSVKSQLCEMLSNFRQNTVNCRQYVDELKNEFEGKDVFLIAAGPSLDKNIKLLSTKPDNSVILAVGSVYKKLISLGIKPDYVTFLDCKQSLYSQVDGLQYDIPFLIASTTCAKIAKNHNGKTYLICQEGLDEAEDYAHEHNFHTYETGGSVATIAYSVAYKLGAKRIIALGLDLALTDGKMHAEASGTQVITTEGAGNIEIPGYYGNTVITTPNMEIYRQWFIQYIKKCKSDNCCTQFINSTEGGGFIEGMENIPLAEVLKQ